MTPNLLKRFKKQNKKHIHVSQKENNRNHIYKCNNCIRSYKRLQNLKNHKKKHSSLRKSKLIYCSCQKWIFNKHIKSHIKTKACRERSIQIKGLSKLIKKINFPTKIHDIMKFFQINYLKLSNDQIIRCAHDFANRTKSAKVKQYLRKKIIFCKSCLNWINSPCMRCYICQDNFHKHCNQGKYFQQQWYCESCIRFVKKRKIITEDIMTKQVIKCFKCHQKCFGKNFICLKCHFFIKSKVKEKNAKFQNFQTTQIQKQTSKQTSKYKKVNGSFSVNYPFMDIKKISNYRKQLLYAIISKQMTYTQQLIPIKCNIPRYKQQTLDFGLSQMSEVEQKTYQIYKKQPFGPFKIKYDTQIGYDVVADLQLPSGMLVCEYVGDVTTFRQIVQQQLTLQHNDSLFQLTKGKTSDETLYIRPYKYTNIARFINGVNSKTGKYKINIKSIKKIINMKIGIFLYTIRTIKKGESLYYDYNADIQAYPTNDFL